MLYLMLVKRSIGVSIVLFWCLMNILLIRRQVWAPPPPITLAAVETVTERMEEWWGVYYRGDKIGYAGQTISPESEGFRIRDFSVLRLHLLGTTQTATTRLDMNVDREWALRRFDFELISNDVRFKAKGTVEPGKMHVEVDSGGHQTQREIPLNQPPYLLAALKPFVATQQLEPGREHFVSTFDPATLSQQVTSVIIEGREHIKNGDRTEPAMRIRQSFRGISVVSWIDGKGRTLREETPAGLSLIRESPDEAKSLSGSRSVPLDLVAQTAIASDTPIADPEAKNLVKLRLGGFNLANFSLDGGRQTLSEDRLEIRREDLSRARSYPIPAREPRFGAFLQPTPFLQSDHPRIRALAQKILAGERDARRAVVRIKDWVYGEIAKEPTVSIPNALEVLRTKKGDCNEHTVLFNALARAAGIPAKTAVGVVYLRGSFYYHAWSEVWLGEWISVDSVLDQFPADATHIKFIEGEIDRQIDILQLIGNLKIEVIEAS